MELLLALGERWRRWDAPGGFRLLNAARVVEDAFAFSEVGDPRQPLIF